MNPWFRFYHEVLDDPKVQKLTLKLFKCWINLLCIACKHDGNITRKDVSFSLRMSDIKAEAVINQLEAAGLLDATPKGFTPHNWSSRQFKSDGSTERVKRFRKRFRNVPGNGFETGPDTDTDTDTEQIQKKKGKKKRETPTPETLTLSPEMLELAKRFGVDAEEQTSAMLDHFRSRGTLRVDWIATWRTWIRNAPKFGGNHFNGNGHQAIHTPISESSRPMGRHLCDVCKPAHEWQEEGEMWRWNDNWVYACEVQRAQMRKTKTL